MGTVEKALVVTLAATLAVGIWQKLTRKEADKHVENANTVHKDQEKVLASAEVAGLA